MLEQRAAKDSQAMHTGPLRLDWVQADAIPRYRPTEVAHVQPTDRDADELTRRLQQQSLFRYISGESFTYSTRGKFLVPLDMNVGIPLNVTVREIYQLGPDIQHAHLAAEGVDGSNSYETCQVWSPPIIMFIKPGQLGRQVTLVQQQINHLYEQVLHSRERWSVWTTDYFPDPAQDFQTTILQLIGQYYRKDIQEHAIIKTGLELLWFEYLLLNKFIVPPQAVPQLEAKLESRRPAGAPHDILVIPATINRFLKAIIMHMAIETARKLTATLHERLFKMSVSQETSTARTDIALCLAFVVLIFVGRTQSSLVLLADSPASESGMEYSFEEAEAKIRAMDDSVCEYLVSFHRYTLSRRSSSKSAEAQASAQGRRNTDSSNNSIIEVHANKFDLVGRLRREVEQEYGKSEDCAFDQRPRADIAAAQERPENLELGKIDLQSFPSQNVGRLCWELFRNVENDRG